MPDLAPKQSNWEDDDDENGFPAPLVTNNTDGTKTVISYRINPETGKKVKVTQKIKTTVVTEHVNPAVATRKRWSKFGFEKDSAPGPNFKTTSVGENMGLKFVIGWKESEDKKAAEEEKKNTPKVHSITCRKCGGDHFTRSCPYSDRLNVPDVASETSNSTTPRTATPEPTASKHAVYVPPHLKNRANRGEGERMSSFRDRDDSATLRVSNINEYATDEDLGRLFERYGRIQRLNLVKERETGRPMGYAFISYYKVEDAERARQRLNGHGFENLILRVEFSKKT
ncbi:eukaryotic translation initiation factor 3 subunit G-domain-containing protein [Lipomyces japonicus]|uniref:eukaryotic translation initiation factor 3 subunit G-domain-containing protein n=1 Tax=Lipomyces japonicus TaxID=56871 RepID=UPI0034CFAE7B